MDYSFSGTISQTREYDPFRQFQAALRNQSSDQGVHHDDRYCHDQLKKQKVENIVRIFAGSEVGEVLSEVGNDTIDLDMTEDEITLNYPSQNRIEIDITGSNDGVCPSFKDYWGRPSSIRSSQLDVEIDELLAIGRDGLLETVVSKHSSHRTLSFSEEILLYSPEMHHNYEYNKITDTPTAIPEFINSNDQVTKFIIHGALVDGLPYEQANCSSTEHISSRRQSSKSKRRQNPTNISKSTLAKSKRNNNRKKNKAVKRLNPVQNSLHQNGLKNLQSSIDYIRTLLK